MKILILSSAESTHTIRWANALSNHDDLEIILVSRQEIKGSLSDRVKFYKLSNSSKLSYFLGVFEIKKIIKLERPDILHAHYASGYGTLAMLSGFRYVLSVWGSDIYDFPSNLIKKSLIKTNLNKASRIYSTSNTMATEIRKYTEKEIRVIPFGVDVNKFKPKVKIEKDAVSIGIVKVIDYKYGIDTLINGFQIYYNKFNSNSVLTIVGDGPQLLEMKNLAIKLKIDHCVKFLGWVDNALLPDTLNGFDLFVLTSRLDSESFGVAAVEASSCGLACIVTNVGGLPEVIDDGISGIVIPKDRPEILAEKINLLIEDKALRLDMGVNGRKKVERLYDWESNVDSMKQNYYDFLNN